MPDVLSVKTKRFQRLAFGIALFAAIAESVCAPVRVAATTTTQVRFYTSTVEIGHDEALAPPRLSAIDERGLTAFYRQMDKLPYKTLLASLQGRREQLGLNDWLYFRLMYLSVAKIYAEATPVQRELLCWFLLAKSGFDARLTYLGKRVFINIYSTDEVFEAPLIQDRGRSFVNISYYFGAKGNVGNSLYLLDFVPNEKGRPFSFYLTAIPALPPADTLMQFRFAYEGRTYHMELPVNRTVVDIMKGYPLIAEFQYLEIPFSASLSKKIAETFQPWMEGKSQRQQLEMLAVFARSGFIYKEDRAIFGQNKPMVADEVLFYPQSDCEDRVALMYNLVRLLLDLPMVVIAYPDHLSLAVALPDGQGDSVVYEGRRYLFCDPTGPVNSAEIGVIPKEYEQQPFEIIGRYK